MPCQLRAHLEVLTAWHPFERGLPCLVLGHHPGAHEHVSVRRPFCVWYLSKAFMLLTRCYLLVSMSSVYGAFSLHFQHKWRRCSTPHVCFHQKLQPVQRPCMSTADARLTSQPLVHEDQIDRQLSALAVLHLMSCICPARRPLIMSTGCTAKPSRMARRRLWS